MNDKRYPLGKIGRITRATPDAQHKIGCMGEIIGASNLGDKLWTVTINTGRDPEDAETVNYADCEIIGLEELVSMYLVSETSARVNAERGNEYEAAYDQALETINTLKTVLRNIHTTAAKAGNEQVTALAWIEGEAARVLRETLEPLA